MTVLTGHPPSNTSLGFPENTSTAFGITETVVFLIFDELLHIAFAGPWILPLLTSVPVQYSVVGHVDKS